MKKRRYYSYIIAGLFLLLTTGILIENSYLLINQTYSNLVETSFSEAEKIVRSVAAGAQQITETVRITPKQIQRHLRRTGQKLGRTETESRLLKIIREDKLRSISIYDGAGKLVIAVSGESSSNKTGSEAPAGEDLEPFQMLDRLEKLDKITIDRIGKPGTIDIVIGPEKLIELKSRIGLQLLIASLENEQMIEYASFVDDQFKVLADYEPSRIGTIDERQEYSNVLDSGESYVFRQGNVVEIYHPLEFTYNYRGVFKLAFKQPRVEQLYQNASRITIFNSIGIMALAIVAAVVILQLYQRNLKRLELMERQIRENEKMVSLANLTAGVAHEVRNPLNSISITIQRLQMEFNPKNDEDTEEYRSLTTTMKKEVDRINTIVTDLLDFSSPFSPKKTKFMVDDFLNESVALFKEEAAKKSVMVIQKSNSNGVEFFGDREKLTQVLINLLRNALDATVENGTITIFSQSDRDQKWELKVKDDGEGISKNNLNQIFDIYFTTKGTGSGLGLYITRKIIQAHHGSIELKPNVGKGVTAIISLPRLQR